MKVYGVFVLRHGGWINCDCSLGGMSSKNDMLKVLDAGNRPELEADRKIYWEAVDKYVAEKKLDPESLLLVDRYSFHGKVPYVRLFPYLPYKADKWCAAGGNFADGDGFFHEDINNYPVAILDRIEK